MLLPGWDSDGAPHPVSGHKELEGLHPRPRSMTGPARARPAVMSRATYQMLADSSGLTRRGPASAWNEQLSIRRRSAIGDRWVSPGPTMGSKGRQKSRCGEGSRCRQHDAPRGLHPTGTVRARVSERA
jgi:hypothetical protein